MAAFWSPASGVHRPTTALTGQVTPPPKKARWKAVLVTAKKDGSTMSTTVVSDAQGRFAFPQGRLEPGPLQSQDPRYRLTSLTSRAVDVTATGAKADVKAQRDPQHRRSADQLGMAHERARHARKEEADLELRDLTRARAPDDVELHREAGQEDLIPRMADHVEPGDADADPEGIVSARRQPQFRQSRPALEVPFSINLSPPRAQFEYKTFPVRKARKRA